MAQSSQAQQAPPPKRGREEKQRARRREERAARSPREPERIFPDPKTGLTAAQAAQLLEQGMGNEAVASNAKSTGQIIRENTLTFFNLVFVVLAALLVLAGDFKDMMFLGIAIVNSLIGIVQQLRSRATLEKLSLISEARVKVVRDGQLGTVPVHKLVREDIVELGAGDQIPADGPVLSGQVTVNEALITGEADPITKDVGDELLSGSFVVSGKCRARLDRVGADFEAGKVFLPQLIQAAGAAQAAFEVIREQLSARPGGESAPKAPIVLATVKGDIHDIGKNIVKVLLENYGYPVIDLGKDVEPAAVVEAAKRHAAPLVGLSALMTTTLPAMEETTRLLKALPNPPVVWVGGAVVTPEYARSIGADYYARDAKQSVEIAKKVLG